MLLLIGVQELGGDRRNSAKEQKQDHDAHSRMHIWQQIGYYRFDGYDEEGWPHFGQLKPFTEHDMIEQENFLRIIY